MFERRGEGVVDRTRRGGHRYYWSIFEDRIVEETLLERDRSSRPDDNGFDRSDMCYLTRSVAPIR